MHRRRLVRPVCPERAKEGVRQTSRPPGARPAAPGTAAPCRCCPSPWHRRAPPPGKQAGAGHRLSRRRYLPGPHGARQPTGGPNDPPRFVVAAHHRYRWGADARPRRASGAPATPSPPPSATIRAPGTRQRGLVDPQPQSSPPSPRTAGPRHPASSPERGTGSPVAAAVPGTTRGPAADSQGREPPRIVVASHHRSPWGADARPRRASGAPATPSPRTPVTARTPRSRQRHRTTAPAPSSPPLHLVLRRPGARSAAGGVTGYPPTCRAIDGRIRWSGGTPVPQRPRHPSGPDPRRSQGGRSCTDRHRAHLPRHRRKRDAGHGWGRVGAAPPPRTRPSPTALRRRRGRRPLLAGTSAL